MKLQYFGGVFQCNLYLLLKQHFISFNIFQYRHLPQKLQHTAVAISTPQTHQIEINLKNPSMAVWPSCYLNSYLWCASHGWENTCTAKMTAAKLRTTQSFLASHAFDGESRICVWCPLLSLGTDFNTFFTHWIATVLTVWCLLPFRFELG